ncbi:kelch-like protein 1 [Paramacrobiotus metropolitanus]|uniref:kelch-like protein 1 n=1 Tax=Paramacrobiotus metropolitanus TaxID=2943436 RepID=UPI002445E879|nr:kelch-like protein 1 [Paramacrobiotus metropolitanus]XP_055336907.1 kelch-like protein 1 [Paramacrobiotus metropolitanus]
MPTPKDCQHVVLLDASTIMLVHSAGRHRLQRDRGYLGLRDEWREVAPMLTPRAEESLAALNGRVYAAGGYSLLVAEGDPLTSVEAYDPLCNAWSAVAPLPLGLSGAVMVACGGRLFLFGGGSPEERGCSFSYDPATDTWTKLHDMPTRHWSFDPPVACAAPNGLIFVLGTSGGSVLGARRCV